jgi:glycosyltransferase involved in cell wall biosynthesis
MISPLLQGEFTVLMSVYKNDDPGLFKSAVQSVFDNSIQPNDFVLVIDGPVYGELSECISSIKKISSIIRILPLPKNVGLAEALNAGLNMVSTEWVARADADDINIVERFEKQIRYISNHHVDVIGGQILEIETDGSVVAQKRVPLDHRKIIRRLRMRSPFNHMTVMFRADAVRKAGGYPAIHLKEDYALWGAMYRDGRTFANLDEILVHASAGIRMFNRRGGFRYAKAEIDLQRHLIRCGVKNAIMGIWHGTMRSIVFLLPNNIRAFVYLHLLRSSPTN